MGSGCQQIGGRCEEFLPWAAGKVGEASCRGTLEPCHHHRLRPLVGRSHPVGDGQATPGPSRLVAATAKQNPSARRSLPADFVQHNERIAQCRRQHRWHCIGACAGGLRAEHQSTFKAGCQPGEWVVAHL